MTNLMAAGVHLILFTTGRGTPLGTAVPTIKVANGKKAKNEENVYEEISIFKEGVTL